MLETVKFKNMRVVILIPTYNEKENITKLLNELLALIAKLKRYTFKILIVDDNSPDNTGQIVKRFKGRSRKIELLSGRKRGLGKAMIRGYLYAMKNLKADVLISNEADFAFDFKHLGYMLEKIEGGSDVLVGSRHVGVGKTKSWTISRRINHWLANTFFATWVAGVNQVYDKNGAFRAIRVKGVLDKINWQKLKVTGFAFFFYSLFKLTQVTDKFHEFPVIYQFRTRGESKVSFNPKYIKIYIKDVLEYIKLAFQIRAEKCMIKI